jgi:hypothetical protein
MGNSPKGEYMLKKENIMKLLGIGIMSLFLLGCAESSFLLTEEESPKMQEVMKNSQIAMDEPVLKNDETAMDELGMEDNQSALEEDVFDGCDNPTLFVPCAALSDYQAHEQWGQFTTIECISSEEAETEEVVVESGTTTIQKLMRDGQLIILRDGVEYNAMGAEIQ